MEPKRCEIYTFPELTGTNMKFGQKSVQSSINITTTVLFYFSFSSVFFFSFSFAGMFRGERSGWKDSLWIQIWNIFSSTWTSESMKRNVQNVHILTVKTDNETWVNISSSSVNMICFVSIHTQRFSSSIAAVSTWPYRVSFLTFHISSCSFFYTSAFWLFSSTFSSNFFSSSEEPSSFSPVFQLPCLLRVETQCFHHWCRFSELCGVLRFIWESRSGSTTLPPRGSYFV